MTRIQALGLGTLLLAGLAVGALVMAADQAATGATRVVHSVYFSLKEPSDAARQALLDDCNAMLAPIPGMVLFAAGVPTDAQSPVNDRDFDVAITCVFPDRAALDAYSASPSHRAFVQKNMASWSKVRVFDSVGGATKP